MAFTMTELGAGKAPRCPYCHVHMDRLYTRPPGVPKDGTYSYHDRGT